MQELNYFYKNNLNMFCIRVPYNFNLGFTKSANTNNAFTLWRLGRLCEQQTVKRRAVPCLSIVF